MTREEIRTERYIEVGDNGVITLYNTKDYPVMTKYLECGYTVIGNSPLLKEVNNAK